MPARVELGFSGIVERQRQAEREAFPNLRHTLQHLPRCQQIEPAPLVIGAEIAPSRARRAPLPARIAHGNFPLEKEAVSPALGAAGSPLATALSTIRADPSRKFYTWLPH